MKTLFISISILHLSNCIQISQPLLDSIVFSGYLNSTNTDNGYIPFGRNVTVPPTYSFNLHTFYDLRIEHRSSPYLLKQLANTSTIYYTCLDTDRLLMFDNDFNQEVDASISLKWYYGFIEVNGESYGHVQFHLNSTKIFMYDTNYLIYLIFKYHNTNSSAGLLYPSPFLPSASSKYSILDPDITPAPIPHYKVKNDLEGLMMNYLYYKNISSTSYANLYWKRFQLASTIYFNYFSNSYAYIQRYDLVQTKDRDIKTSVVALTLMYLSDLIFSSGGESSSDYVKYLSLRGWLYSVQQTPTSLLSSNPNLQTSDSIRGGWLEYMDTTRYPNYINLKASALVLFALGLNAALTIDPHRNPMSRCGSGINYYSYMYGNAYLYTYSESCNRMFWGPYITISAGNYRVYFLYTGHYINEIFINRGSDTGMIIEVYYDGGVRGSYTVRNDGFPNDWSVWYKSSFTFSISSPKMIEVRGYMNSIDKAVGTIKLVRI